MNNDILMHIGTPHEGMIPHSGRYAYGSGETPYQRGLDFYTSYKRLEAQGYSKREIAERLGVVKQYGKDKGKPDLTRLKARYSVAQAEIRAHNIAEARRLADEGYGPSEISRKMGDIGESKVRYWLKESTAINATKTQQTAKLLKDYVDKYQYVDVGHGTEVYLGVTSTRLKTAIAELEEQGYKLQTVKIDQMGTDHQTTLKVLTADNVDYGELYANRFDIKYPSQDSKTINSNGEIASIGLGHKPIAISPDRVMINYAETGGLDKDGLIELRRGVDDISLGGAMYAQVRINVGDTHYLKGMAVYRDNMPPGVDIIFNTNKHQGTPMIGDEDHEVLKKLKIDKTTGEVDWSNPFGASVTQKEYTDADGTKRYSASNVVREEGEWLTKWNDNLASQFLSKQSIAMAERQLNIAYGDSKKEFEDICALTNPTVKRKLLEDFADNADAAAVELKAAPFPNQHWHVLLPEPKLKDNECYAPNYKDGTQLALIRYPHAGRFEIPIVTVRNTGSPAESFMKNAPDAIAVNKTNLDRLSGADTDGDAVVAIPLSDKVRVRSDKALPGLEGFDPKERYPGYPGMKPMDEHTKQIEMGKVSNLITDMTLQGAGRSDLERATRHSMVVIDAKKHGLNWQQSAKDNDIDQLKEKYQKGGGAATIISRASSEYDVFERKDWKPSEKSIGPNGEKIPEYTDATYKRGNLKPFTEIDGRKRYLSKNRKSGEYYYEDTDISTGKVKRVTVPIDRVNTGGKIFVNEDKEGHMYILEKDISTGKKVRRYVTDEDFKAPIRTYNKLEKSTKMAETKDAYTLTSGGSRENYGYPMERVYAEYANHQKALGNAARKEWLATGKLEKDPQAAKKYAKEVESLNKKLEAAYANAPLERQAQLIANRDVAIKKKSNPDMSDDDLGKLQDRAISLARKQTGAKKKDTLIKITDDEWTAIQNHAISDHKLRQILDNSDMDRVRELATPRNHKTITATTKSLVRAMYNAGYTASDIADRYGISVSTIYAITKKEEGD